MKVTAEIIRLELAETFVIAREAADWAEVVQVTISHEGVDGRGEGAPIERYGESAASALAFVEEHAAVVGDDPFAVEEIEARLSDLPGEQAAKSAFDAALHDLQGKLVGRPTWQLLGLPRRGPQTSWTVWLGDPDDMARRAAAASERFGRLKLKLGGGDGLDLERVKAVRTVTDRPLQVDVNEWWSLDEAITACDELATLGVEYVEQPLPAGDAGGAELRRRSPLPIYVDEDCHTLRDVDGCREIAHGINLKLAKSGGIREAIRMSHAARALGLGVMLGCMVESGLGIAAGCCVAPLCDHVDLDGDLLLARDPTPGPRLVSGIQDPGEGPGLAAGERTLILAEGHSADPHHGKTMRGVLRYRADDVVAIVDSERAGAMVDGKPVLRNVEAALPFRPEVALVGVATQGGRFPTAWRILLADCIRHGLGIENGLHEFVADDPELAGLAAAAGVALRDLRRPPAGLDCPTGANLDVDAHIVLTVGSDCAIGKMTVALELERVARDRGIASRFVPTGQTGIAIAGWGTAVDAVTADFIAGAAERLVVEGRALGAELLFVEGQGSIVHPAYSGVTLGLLHGSAPHTLVLCHRAGQTEVEGYPGHPLPSLVELVGLYESAALPIRRPRVACIALNTGGLSQAQAEQEIVDTTAATGLVVDDPVRNGPSLLLDQVLAMR